MEIITIKEDKLKINQKNLNTHNSKSLEKIKNSIEAFGFQNPLLIDDENIVIAGNGRLEAGRQAGLKEFPCIRIEGLTPEQLTAYGIADNRIQEDSFFDMEELSITLKGLEELNFDLAPIGFDDDELNGILDGVEAPEEKEAPSMPQAEKECPHCGELCKGE